MFCPNCGNELKDGSVFCPNCGIEINNKQDLFSKIKNNKKLSMGIIISSVIILLFIIVFGVINNNAVRDGWSKDGNSFYVDGKKIKGDWVIYNSNWYYIDNNGKYVQNDWIESGGNYYYLGENGVLVKNQWVGQYYVSQDGMMMKNFLTPDGYYVGSDGKYVTNMWIEIIGNYYYFLDNGCMARNMWVGDYYVGVNGIMLRNTYTPDGYWVSIDGKKQVNLNNNNIQNNKKGFDPELVKKYKEVKEREKSGGSIMSTERQYKEAKFDSSGKLWLKGGAGGSRDGTSYIDIYTSKNKRDSYYYEWGWMGTRILKNNQTISESSYDSISNQFDKLVDAYK